MSRPASRKTGLSPSKPAKHGLAITDARTPKRPRLASSHQAKLLVENVAAQRGPSLPTSRCGQKERNGEDEQALLDELMAGLDASVFDYIPSSPYVSQKNPSQPSPRANTILLDHPMPMQWQTRRSGPAKSPTKCPPIRWKPLSPIKRIAHAPRVQPIAVKLEDSAPIGGESHHVKREDLPHAAASLAIEVDQAVVKEEKPELEDELFEFDFDLTDIAGLDDDALCKQPHEVSRSSR